ncbi:hypothetical protein CRM22_001279 [Opisthorchis felineus]|uniref:Uncharacterized protein n=1 Tax=Opisthorchis felineus TaxID=147828 RepID=A0A4S2MBL4_OPIFE|nr:hypothetical protein CRM22_001279 [Opisthorchis felineus]
MAYQHPFSLHLQRSKFKASMGPHISPALSLDDKAVNISICFKENTTGIPNPQLACIATCFAKQLCFLPIQTIRATARTIYEHIIEKSINRLVVVRSHESSTRLNARNIRG